MKKNLNMKSKKGSISIFVLIILLFMSSFLLILFAGNVNKSKVLAEQIDIIKQIYTYSGGAKGAYDKSYTDLRKKNRQIMTATIEGAENTASIELTKTFEEDMKNYRIYGTSEGVGDKIENIFNPADIDNNNEYISTVEYNGRNCLTWCQNVNAEKIKILEGMFEESATYTVSGYITSTTNKIGYWYVVYTDGTEKIINFDHINMIENPGEFEKVLFTIGNGKKTISHIRGCHNNAQNIYIDISSFQIISLEHTINEYIEYNKLKFLVSLDVNTDSLNLFNKDNYEVVKGLSFSGSRNRSSDRNL